MFERFTDQATDALTTAQDEMRALHHPFVGSDAILLGLLKQSTGIAARVLASLGVEYETAYEEVRKIIGVGNSSSGELAFTPRAKRVLELSWDEARQLGVDKIGTEHLLLAILRDENGVGYKVLNTLRADVSKVRPLTLSLLPGLPGVRFPRPSITAEKSTFTPNIAGAEQIIERLGCWPAFHDAEILELHLLRDGNSRLLVQMPYNDTTLVVRFTLHNVTGLYLNDFNHQNVIFELSIVQRPDKSRITLSPSYGTSGYIEADNISVELLQTSS